MTRPNRSPVNGSQLVGAYRAGITARDEQLPVLACPYEAGDERRPAWLRGYLDARRVELYGDT